MRLEHRTFLGSGRLLFSAILFSIGVALCLPHHALATSLFRFENRRENEGKWRLVPEFYSLSTAANNDATGAKVPVSGLTAYKKNQFDLTAVYGITSKFSVYGRLSAAAVSFNTTSLTASGSGLTEQGLGANYRLWESKNPGNVRQTSIDGQISLDIPMYNNVNSRASIPRQPLRGEGSLDVTAATFGTLPLNQPPKQGSGQRLYGILGLGLMIRGEGYGRGIPYQLQVVGLPEREGLLYRFGFHGFKSLIAEVNNVSALSPQSRSSPGTLDPADAGGSFIVDALNSSYLQMRLTAGYQWSAGDQIFVTYFVPMSGTSTAVINGFLVGAQFRFGSGKSTIVTAESTPTPNSSSKNASYDLEGRVTEANDRLNLIKIDKGESDGMQTGQVVDIYRVGSDGLAKDLVARGVVTNVNGSESVINLRQYKKEVWVQKGFIARRIASH